MLYIHVVGITFSISIIHYVYCVHLVPKGNPATALLLVNPKRRVQSHSGVHLSCGVYLLAGMTITTRYTPILAVCSLTAGHIPILTGYTHPRVAPRRPREIHQTSCIPHVRCTNSGWGKREAHKKGSTAIPEKAAPVAGATLRATGPAPADSPP